MKKLVIFLLLAFLVGCGDHGKFMQDGVLYPPAYPTEYQTLCIDGVKYITFTGHAGYQGYGYMSVKFKKDSTVETCN